MGRVARTGFLLAAVASAVAVADLTHKAHALGAHGAAVPLHERSALWALGVVLASAAWSLAVVATRSRGLALVAGLLLGGAFGNALSWLFWPARDGVPNPWLARGDGWGVAFNAADVAVAAALVLVIPVAGLFALRNRGRLRERVVLRP